MEDWPVYDTISCVFYSGVRGRYPGTTYSSSTMQPQVSFFAKLEEATSSFIDSCSITLPILKPIQALLCQQRVGRRNFHLKRCLPNRCCQLEQMESRMSGQHNSLPPQFSPKFHTSCLAGMSYVPPMHAFVAPVAHPFHHHLPSKGESN